MSDKFEANAERVLGATSTAKAFAAMALEQGHPLLKEAGLEGALPPEAVHHDRAQLESLGAGTAMLEAIIRLTNRPPLIFRNGAVVLDGIDLPPPDFPPDINDRIRAVEPRIASVGRIEFINHDMDWGGTGWVIAQDGPGHLLVATNRHVAQIVARRTAFGTGAFLFDPAGGGRYGAQIDFNEEEGAPEDMARVAVIERFTYIAEDTAADVALARIAVPSAFRVEPLTLAEAEGRNGEPIAVIGYPARDSRNDQDAMERYFQGLYDVKRFSPGLLRVQPGATRLSHDATTLGGNSGSPVISLETKDVVGLHFAGKYGVANSAVRVGTLKAILSGSRTQVAVGGGGGAQAEDSEGRDGTHTAQDLADRPGYDPAFLGHFTVPMPDPAEVPNVALAEPSDAAAERPFELRYQHFGVLYCRNYRSPVVTAVNIDGGQPFHIKRSSDRWFYDLRIPREIQIGSEAYSDMGVDRGHIVKRDMPNWGTDAAIVKRANFDTFHFTNCSPQHGRFNRNVQTWLGLEEHLMESSETHGLKLSVFSGPVLGEELDFIEEHNLFLPREYWKVVVMPVDDEGTLRPHATAYLLSQGQLIQQLLQQRGRTEAVEGFVFGEYKTFQVPVRTLETMCGVSFGDLHKFDPLEALETEFAGPAYVTLDSLGDIRLRATG